MAYKSGNYLNKRRNTFSYEGSHSGTLDYASRRLTKDDFNVKYPGAMGAITVKALKKSSSNDAASNVFDAYGGQVRFGIPVQFGVTDASVEGGNVWRHRSTKRPVKTEHKELPISFNNQWLYGAAVRVYSDGTGAGVFYLDSEIVSGEKTSKFLITGGNRQHLRAAKSDSDLNVLRANTTASAPDSDFKNTVADSDWGGDRSRSIIYTNLSQVAYQYDQSNRTTIRLKNVEIDFFETFDSDYDTRNFIERGAYEDAQASGGAGETDPESWS